MLNKRKRCFSGVCLLFSQKWPFFFSSGIFLDRPSLQRFLEESVHLCTWSGRPSHPLLASHPTRASPAGFSWLPLPVAMRASGRVMILVWGLLILATCAPLIWEAGRSFGREAAWRWRERRAWTELWLAACFISSVHSHLSERRQMHRSSLEASVLGVCQTGVKRRITMAMCSGIRWV